MSWELVFFIVFAATMLICAIGVVAFENPVHSAVALVGTFINVAALFVMLAAEFLAVLQIIIYTGAVLVLILLTVMLVDPKKLPDFYIGKPIQRNVSAIVGVILLAEVALVIVARNALDLIGPHTNAMVENMGGNVQAVGQVLMGNYTLSLEIASVLLGVGVIGAVVIGLPERKEPVSVGTTSLGHSRGSEEALAAGHKFESPMNIPPERYVAPEGQRKVVMTRDADDYKHPGETSK